MSAMLGLPVTLFVLPFVGALVAGALSPFRPRAARFATAGTLVATAVLSAAAIVESATCPRSEHLAGWAPPLGIEWSLDPLGAFMAAVVATVASLAVVGPGAQVHDELRDRSGAFHACVLLLVAGLIGMSLTADLFNLFVFVELSSLSAYALVASGGPGAPGAAMRYLIAGSLGAAFFLLGVGHVYAATGSLNLHDAALGLQSGADEHLVTLGVGLMLGGLAVKMGLFPLHGWVPGAYARAPAPAAALMAPLVTKVSAAALIRVVTGLFGTGFAQSRSGFAAMLLAAGIAAMLFGGLRALVARDLRRVFAYSSVSQIGLVAIAVALSTPAALQGAVVHLANDAFAKAVLFLAVIVAARFGVRTVADLPRLRGRCPWTRAMIVVAGLSLIGIPPFGGFFSKWYILHAALEANAFLAVAGVVGGTLVTIAYVVRLFEALFFRRPSVALALDPRDAREGPPLLVGACGIAATLLLVLGLVSAPLLEEFLAGAGSWGR